MGCTNGEFFGWEANAKTILKLLTPCTGQWGGEPSELWQKNDPTWRITDRWKGLSKETQGRMLWSLAESAAAPLTSSQRQHAGQNYSCFAWLPCLTENSNGTSRRRAVIGDGGGD